MIRLTINPKTTAKTLSFNKPQVVIGYSLSQEDYQDIDLLLPEESLQKHHIKISQQDDRFVVMNLANDPFITLNSFPFGKKTIKDKDILQLGQTFIRFDGENSSKELETSGNLQQESVINEKVGQENLDVDALFREVEQLLDNSSTETEKNDILHELPIETLEDKIEEEISEKQEEILEIRPEENQIPLVFNEPELKLEPEPESESTVTPETISEMELLEETSIKSEEILLPQVEIEKIQMPLQDSEVPIFTMDTTLPEKEENAKEENAKEDNSNGNNQNPQGEKSWGWRFWILLFLITLAVLGILTTGLYFSERSKNQIDKIKAAENVADVAMALVYAQINHIRPNEQNWFDPDFIRINLASVVSSKYPSLANIDAQGIFNNSSYILRIYTSSNLSQFLLIAQPEPSVLQWLFPKTAIVVDSKSMELRNISDLKVLNRLLASQNSLDGTNAVEISHLVKQGELIPLEFLASHANSNGFIPPKALSLVRPNAENYIYNAPRYYQFGEDVLRKAISLLQFTGNGQEVARLRNEAQDIAKFPDIVLYSSQGLQTAILGQKALGTLIPSVNFLIAYLGFSEEGNINNSHLILGEDNTGVVANSFSSGSEIDFSPEPYHPVYTATPSNMITMSTPQHSISPGFQEEVDHNHPLYLQLIALANERQSTLHIESEKINSLLQKQNHAIEHNFIATLQALIKKYEQIDIEQQNKISRGLVKLYQEHSDIPLVHFIAYVRAAGLQTFAKENLDNRAETMRDLQLSPQQISILLGKIQQADTFVELEQHVKDSSDLLTLQHLPDADKLVIHQNEMRNQTLQRTGHFIFSPNSNMPENTFQEENRAALSRILKMAWVSDPDEIDYYLSEFDLRQKPVSH